MTKLTALIIATRRDELHIALCSQERGSYFVISVGQNRRPLVTSSPRFTSPADADTAAHNLIEAVAELFNTPVPISEMV